MNALITGFFGAGNLGDDLILSGFTGSYPEREELTLLLTFGEAPVSAQIKTADLSRLPHGKSVWVDQWAARRYDGLFWIGGTCMTDRAGDGAYRYMRSFSDRGKKTGYIGIGIGQITDPDRREKYRRLLDEAAVVTLRDQESWSIAQELSDHPNIRLTEDLAYLCPEVIGPRPTDNGPPYWLISWRALGGYAGEADEEAGLDELFTFLCGQEDQWRSLRIAVLGNSVDRPANQKLYERLKERYGEERLAFVETVSMKERLALIRGANRVIAGRLHVVFVAEWNGIPTTALVYDDKISRFLRDIGRAADGVPAGLVTRERLAAPDFMSGARLTRADFEQRTERAKENIQLLRQALTQ